MMTVNQKCNALQAIIGIHAHANNTSDKVFGVMSRLGVSTSVGTTHCAVDSLSVDVDGAILELGQSLTAAWAYDNLEIDLKSAKFTREASMAASLKHLTSALVFPLPAGTVKEHLRVSEELWQQSRLNDELPDDRPGLAPLPDWRNLSRIHLEHRHYDGSGMLWRDRWNAWKFLHNLIHYGPLYFRKFQKQLQDPKVIEQIPLTRTQTIPACTMDVCNSSVSGNIETLEKLLEQAGVGDSDEVEDPALIKDMREFVILFHGDLGTGERIAQAQAQRSIEATAFRRLQFAIFVFGLFHLKMACADAIHRVLIAPSESHCDLCSVMAHVGILRPKETGKIGSNQAGFRRTHQVIEHDGICRRLNSWKELVLERNPSNTDLDVYALSEPTYEDIATMANYLAMNFVARPKDLDEMRSQALEDRDLELENNLVISQLYLLYEETSYAMNVGDIGRLELCMEPWAYIFKATGKHKYAAELIKHITNVHFYYKPELRCVCLAWHICVT